MMLLLPYTSSKMTPSFSPACWLRGAVPGYKRPAIKQNLPATQSVSGGEAIAGDAKQPRDGIQFFKLVEKSIYLDT
jgi:hypothetical protein